MDNNNGSRPDVSASLEAALRGVQPQGVQEILTPLIERTLVQCYALLRQELERKVKREPLLYSPFRVERVMREFRTVTEDIKSTIARRVEARILELVQQEARRVFDYALSEAQDPLSDPVWVGQGAQAPPQDSSPAALRPNEPNPGPTTEHPTEHPRKEKPLSPPGPDREGPRLPGRAPPAPSIGQLAASTLPSVAPVKPAPGNGSGPASAVELLESHPIHPAPQPQAPAGEDGEDEAYEGTVQLNVEGNADIRCLVHFIESLRQKPQLRLMQLVGNYKDGVTIWVGLREPTLLKKMLLDMEHVSRVSVPLGKAPDGSEHLLKVWLTKALLP